VPLDPAVRSCLSRLATALVGCALPQATLADDIAGNFDFYVLALSWSPAFCASEGDTDGLQCGGPHGFIVHGLWPQYESGYPEDCRSPMDGWVSSDVVESLRDIMPGGGLVGSQWRKHGLCSGLQQEDYFAVVRQAYKRIALPEAFGASGRDQSLPPASIEAAFIDANPGLTSGGIAVTCKQNTLSEVRICLTADLEFRECREVNKDGCRASRIDIPAIE
jgi:ribonuclease T2